jgi:hypothetical protein
MLVKPSNISIGFKGLNVNVLMFAWLIPHSVTVKLAYVNKQAKLMIFRKLTTLS